MKEITTVNTIRIKIYIHIFFFASDKMNEYLNIHIY